MNALNLFDVLNGTADTSNKTQSAEDVEKRLQERSLLKKVNDIIKKDEYGKSKYSKKINSGYSKEIYRDKNSGFYWNGFFSNSSDKKAGFNDKNESAYKQYMVELLDFQNSLGEDESLGMNLLLKSIDSCSINHNGNRINTNI